MSDLIRTINQADALADLWREGKLLAIEFAGRLVDLGFYAIDIDPIRVVAYFNGVRFVL